MLFFVCLICDRWQGCQFCPCLNSCPVLPFPSCTSLLSLTHGTLDRPIALSPRTSKWRSPSSATFGFGGSEGPEFDIAVMVDGRARELKGKQISPCKTGQLTSNKNKRRPRPPHRQSANKRKTMLINANKTHILMRKIMKE